MFQNDQGKIWVSLMALPSAYDDLTLPIQSYQLQATWCCWRLPFKRERVQSETSLFGSLSIEELKMEFRIFRPKWTAEEFWRLLGCHLDIGRRELVRYWQFWTEKVRTVEGKKLNPFRSWSTQCKYRQVSNFKIWNLSENSSTQAPSKTGSKLGQNLNLNYSTATSTSK